MAEVRYEGYPRVFRMRPLSTLFFFLLMFVGVVLVGMGRYASAQAVNGLAGGVGGLSPDMLQLIGIALFGLAGARLYAWYAPTRFNRLTVTDEAVISTRGFLDKQQMVIPLSAVRELKVDQTDWQRWLWIGDISVYTVGDQPNLVVRGLPLPEEIVAAVGRGSRA